MAKAVTLALAVLTLSGCQYLMANKYGQPFCTAARPIYPDKKDVLTPATTRLIVGHDEIGERLCGWKPPSP